MAAAISPTGDRRHVHRSLRHRRRDRPGSPWAELETAALEGVETTDDPRRLSTPKLVEYVVARHHEYLRKALPFVEQLRAMHDEHVHVGESLTRIRTLADDYAVPEWGCGSYRALLNELRSIEMDTLRHVQIENHVLMPRFVGAGGPLSRYMAAEHARLEALLEASVQDPDRFDATAFEQFRAGLLRHIAVEEKVLLPDARRRRGGDPLPVARLLRVEHGALASLLVPTPDRALVDEIRTLLRSHDAPPRCSRRRTTPRRSPRRRTSTARGRVARLRPPFEGTARGK